MTYHAEVWVVFGTSPGFAGGTTSARPTHANEIQINSNLWGGLTGGDANVRLHVFGSTDGTVVHVLTAALGDPLVHWEIQKVKDPITTDWPVQWSASMSYDTGLLTAGEFVHNAWIDGGAAVLSLTGETIFKPGGSNERIVDFSGPDDQSGEDPFCGMGLFSTTPTKYGRKGALTDCYWGLTGSAVGTTFPASGTKLWVQLGDRIFPWNGTDIGLT